VAYAIKLTQSPQQVDANDIASVRKAGLSDRAIHDVVAIVSYFNFVNRLASGLGVELEGEDEAS
jgi:alkylhydroperoxidase family enzyme